MKFVGLSELLEAKATLSCAIKEPFVRLNQIFKGLSQSGISQSMCERNSNKNARKQLAKVAIKYARRMK